MRKTLAALVAALMLAAGFALATSGSASACAASCGTPPPICASGNCYPTTTPICASGVCTPTSAGASQQTLERHGKPVKRLRHRHATR